MLSVYETVRIASKRNEARPGTEPLPWRAISNRLFPFLQYVALEFGGWKPPLPLLVFSGLGRSRLSAIGAGEPYPKAPSRADGGAT